MKKHWKKIIIGSVILLALTNPTVKDFEDYAGHGKRTGYYLIFSTYEYSYIIKKGNHEGKIFPSKFWSGKTTYIGIFKNFIRVSG